MRAFTIILVYLLLSTSWTALASHMRARNLRQNEDLQEAVSRLWGAVHRQRSPALRFGESIAPLDDSTLEVGLKLDYRQKGLFWYSTYAVDFDGLYLGTNPGHGRHGQLRFPLPAANGMYSEVRILVDGQICSGRPENGEIYLDLDWAPCQTRKIEIHYLSQGCDQWWYDFRPEAGSPSRSLKLHLTTNFDDLDFPDGSVSPTQKAPCDLTWSYTDLLSGSQIGLVLPKRANLGPRLVAICQSAPLGLMLFLLVVSVSAAAGQQYLHPVHYIFLGAGIFSFHLLLAYLGDVTPLPVAFSFAALAAISILVSYMARVAGPGFAYRRVAPALLLYLVVFSAAFLVEAYPGLLVASLLVVTLHLLMRASAGIDWQSLEAPEETPSVD